MPERSANVIKIAEKFDKVVVGPGPKGTKQNPMPKDYYDAGFTTITDFLSRDEKV